MFGISLLLCAVIAEPVDLSEELGKIRAQHDIAAMACAAYVDGELAYTGATGWYSYENTTPVTLDSRFHIGSCTKAMTAVLMGMLVEEGKVTWETSVAEALDGVSDEVKEHWSTVTVSDLLAHRSGINENQDRALFFLPWSMNTEEEMHTPREQRSRITQAVLGMPPQLAGDEGSMPYAYSNFGYILAGAILEFHFDASYEDLMHEKIFVPLAMKTAGFGAPGEPSVWDEPVGHTKADEWKAMVEEEGDREPDNPPAYAPAGRVHASILDWAKFVKDFDRGLDGEGELLETETYRFIAEDPEDDGYALGWGRSEREWAGGVTLSHAGSNTMWYAVTWFAPEKDLAMVVASNVPPNPGSVACDQAIGLMVERFAADARESGSLSDSEETTNRSENQGEE